MKALQKKTQNNHKKTVYSNGADIEISQISYLILQKIYIYKEEENHSQRPKYKKYFSTRFKTFIKSTEKVAVQVTTGLENPKWVEDWIHALFQVILG